MKTDKVLIVHHDFRAYRPEENQTSIYGDKKEGYAQMQVSQWDLTNIEKAVKELESIIISGRCRNNQKLDKVKELFGI